jgi:CheY-like chemotaxis protein
LTFFSSISSPRNGSAVEADLFERTVSENENSASILVVDDNDDIRFLIGRHLRTEFEVIEADCGPAALSRLSEGDPPDLIVLDVQMPDMDGWETLKAIRAQERTAQVPVVMCTVKASPEDVVRAEELGASGYVVKPFSLAQLVEAVRGALDGEAMPVLAEQLAR